MDKLVWCAVNISQGNNEETLRKIRNLFQLFHHVSLKHVDTGKSVNRSVFSFFATQEAFPMFAKAFFQLVLERIDMQIHTGSHPRIGAIDVFPVVPLNHSTEKEVKELIRNTGTQLAQEFRLPVYFYEDSQEEPHRKRLEQIRKGNYEGLASKMVQPDWQPDAGPIDFQPAKGATVMGLRKPLVAVNFSLAATDLSVAKKIARAIRFSNTTSKNRLAGVKAIGWKIPEYGFAQVSVNITDTEATSLKAVFDKVNELAKEKDTAIHETELIGLLPVSILTDGFSDQEQAINYLKLNNPKNPNLAGRIFELRSAKL